MDKLSIVTPVYGCARSLEELYERVAGVMQTLEVDFELLMVCDNSPDDAWAVIEALALQDARVRGIKFSRNFGQHYAISAGIDYALGDYVVVMDCDLQDQPEEIAKLYRKIKADTLDVVFGKRVRRADGFFKRFGSKVFYTIYNYFTEAKVDSSVANFSIISRKVAQNFRRFNEHSRLYPLFINWLGFKRADIEIEHAKREEGKSSYSLAKLINLAIDSIVAQSNKPLKLSIKFGFIISTLSMLYGFYLIAKYLLWGVSVEGWTSVMVSIYFIAGLIIANFGILGLYIGKIYDEAKNRPLYVVDETTFKEA